MPKNRKQILHDVDTEEANAQTFGIFFQICLKIFDIDFFKVPLYHYMIKDGFGIILYHFEFFLLKIIKDIEETIILKNIRKILAFYSLNFIFRINLVKKLNFSPKCFSC